MTLDSTPFGTNARIVAVDGTSALAKRLMEMGLVPGARVSVIRSAPLGDPLQIRVQDYNLALRRVEARTIAVVYDIE